MTKYQSLVPFSILHLWTFSIHTKLQGTRGEGGERGAPAAGHTISNMNVYTNTNTNGICQVQIQIQIQQVTTFRT